MPNPIKFARTKEETCAGKSRFKTALKAIKFADRKGYDLRAYRCNICRQWHLTRLEPTGPLQRSSVS